MGISRSSCGECQRRERELLIVFTVAVVIQSVVFALALQWGGKWAEYAPYAFVGIAVAAVAVPYRIYKWRQGRKGGKGQDPGSPG